MLAGALARLCLPQSQGRQSVSEVETAALEGSRATLMHGARVRRSKR